MSKYSLHTRLHLWATDNEYAIEPHGTDDLSLVINRRTGELSLAPLNTSRNFHSSPLLIYGLMGIITLSTSEPYTNASRIEVLTLTP